MSDGTMLAGKHTKAVAMATFMLTVATLLHWINRLTVLKTKALQLPKFAILANYFSR